MIYFKKHRTENGDMIAMCDEKIIGNVYKDKKTGTVIDLKKYSNFYKGELVETVKALEMLKDVYLYTGNIVGNEAVSVIIKAGLADGSEVIKIDNIPSLQIYRILGK
ncbi:MAG: DUF424 family protein [Candidatus Micrarchaeaceae archaeon]